MNDLEKLASASPDDDINWTQEELKVWYDAGLIPKDLLTPSRIVEFHQYMRENKQKLHEHYRRDPSQDKFVAIIPPQEEWHKAPDIKIIDRSTGEVVQTLEMAANFNLCEGVCLQVKAKEIPEWEKETAPAKKLTKEQNEELKSFVTSYGKDRPLTRKEIVTFLEEVRKPKKSKTFRQSRELIDNKLDRQETQLTIFDNIEQNKTNEIQENPTIKGLDLDQGEDRLVHTLTLLLNRKSETKDQKSENYYMGNYGKGKVFINNIEMETARIIITPHELYSTYYGKENYGSDQIKFVLSKLDSLSKKIFLTTWNIPTKSKGKQRRYDKFRTYLPLFQIAILNQDLSESESQEIDNNKSLLEGKNCHFVFKFQPQFTNNIRERYVEFPEDIYLRIAEAAGKDRFSQSINLMRDFLFREKQAKRVEVTRDKDTLIKILKLDKFWREGRKKKVNEMIIECFKIFLKIGLISSYKETNGKLGQIQYNIQINQDFK